jgi:hypothetical protein
MRAIETGKNIELVSRNLVMIVLVPSACTDSPNLAHVGLNACLSHAAVCHTLGARFRIVMAIASNKLPNKTAAAASILACPLIA